MADETGNYTLNALCWAVENGIVNDEDEEVYASAAKYSIYWHGL